MAMRQSSLPEMVAQSRDVLANPSVPTFERYEHRGSMSNAAVYVGAAALFAAILGMVSTLLPGPPDASLGGFFSGFIGGLLTALTQFFVFTGMVYYLAKTMYNGSGNWDEVSYTFSLFSAPLIALGAVLSFIVALFVWVPLLGALVGLAAGLVGILLMLVQIYYGYLAVQSSMNLRNPTQAIIVLVLAFIAAALVMGIVSWIF